MKPLILDFLRRWRWLFVTSLLISAATGAAGFPIVIAPATVVALMLDAQRGVFRAVRPLPITRLDQAKAWWFVGVPLLPMLAVPVLALGVLLFQQINPAGHVGFFQPSAAIPSEAPPPLVVPPEEKTGSSVPPGAAPGKVDRFLAAPVRNQNARAPWFAAGVQAWVALGYAGFCFFLLQWAPTRAPENLAEHMQQGVFGLLWGLSMPGVVFLFPNLPRTPAAIAGWHWAIFAAAPVLVALSYVGAADVVQKRMVITGVKARPQADAQSGAFGGGLTGVPLYMVTFAGRIVLMLVAMAWVQIIVMRWMLGGKLPANNPAMVTQIVMMGLMIGTLTTEAIGIRGLRVLPLSTMRLAVLLSLISWTAALTGAAFATMRCHMGDPALPVWQNFGGYALAMGGWATLALAATLHVSSTWRVFLLMLFVMVPAGCISIFQTHTPIFAAIGAVSGIAGFALLVRGLRKSAAFYRPRGFFGMTPGQPSAVR